MHKIAYLLTGAALSAGLALAGASAASASTTNVAAPAGATPIGTITGQYLGGYVASGALRLTNVRANPVDLPNLSGYSGPPNTVADGVTLAETTSSTTTDYGIGLVWDASTTTCAADQYTLEAGAGMPTAPGDPVPLADLLASNAQIFGADVCVSPGQSDMYSVYQSSGEHEVIFAATPAGTGAIPQSDQVVLSDIPHVHTQFFAAGVGVDVSTGLDAALLPSGTLTDFGGIGNGLTYIGGSLHHGDGARARRITFDSGLENTFMVNATNNGLVKSPSNEYTLLPGSFGIGSAFSVTVP